MTRPSLERKIYNASHSRTIEKMEPQRLLVYDRLDAALKIAREALKGTKLTMKDIEKAVKSVRRNAYGKKSRVVI
jgi:hypothetical protein